MACGKRRAIRESIDSNSIRPIYKMVLESSKMVNALKKEILVLERKYIGFSERCLELISSH